ncbi:MAG: corrinoid protein [Ignavibacteriaceae bacterium]|jgi:5-methyltetrahydrofolate--homocysteine methyltransferase|nr:corrinoid protein [Ignavibacteriaceae bacterium]HPO56407.1 corrinoid protein [Ignavibacteriaceae bacterium]
MENILEKIALCVERGKVNKASLFPADLKGEEGADELTLKAINSGIHPSEILNAGLIEGMRRIGEKFRLNKAFVPDVLISAKAMNTAMIHIKPFFLSNEIKSKGKVLIGTVMGDLHDIGKNIVGMIIRGGGWEVIDVGVDVTPKKFVETARTEKPDAICLSALLTTTMLNMENIVTEIKGVFPEMPVLVGGAPLTMEYANSINADFYSPDPQKALDFLNNIKHTK